MLGYCLLSDSDMIWVVTCTLFVGRLQGSLLQGSMAAGAFLLPHLVLREFNCSACCATFFMLSQQQASTERLCIQHEHVHFLCGCMSLQAQYSVFSVDAVMLLLWLM